MAAYCLSGGRNQSGALEVCLLAVNILSYSTTSLASSQQSNVIAAQQEKEKIEYIHTKQIHLNVLDVRLGQIKTSCIEMSQHAATFEQSHKLIPCMYSMFIPRLQNFFSLKPNAGNDGREIKLHAPFPDLESLDLSSHKP